MQPGFARLLHAFRQTAGGHRMAWAGPAGATGRSTAVPIILMRYRAVVRSVRSFGNRTYQRHRV